MSASARSQRSQASPVIVGTSGYSYRHWRAGVFYPRGLKQKDELGFFAEHFRSVEINNSFYRLPSEEAFKAWGERTPDDFVFAVKASRFITHVKRLHDCRQPLETLLERARALRAKLGPILFQLPETAHADLERLEEFLALLPARRRFSFEFRHPSWFCDEVYRLLTKAGAALCWAVNPDHPDPPEIRTAPFIYLRMHAGRGAEGNFSGIELRRWSQTLLRLRREGLGIYVYFNNDWRGLAIRNALTLRKLLAVTR